jgi:outer membrane protein assembly factor BamA
VGTEIIEDPVTGNRRAVLADGPTDFLNQGNGNGRCNNLSDKKLSDFDDVGETDVIGGNKFFTSTIEYRFPISEEIGLQGIGFFDMGAVTEEEVSLFDTTEWRYGYGGGVLWFSPFGPLQLVLGFPINPEDFEKSPVFEFSVGGFGL